MQKEEVQEVQGQKRPAASPPRLRNVESCRLLPMVKAARELFIRRMPTLRGRRCRKPKAIHLPRTGSCKITTRSTKIYLHTVMEERTRNLARSIFNHDVRSSPPQTAGGTDRARERQQPSEATAEYLPTATLSFRRTAPLTAPTNRPAVTGDDEPDIAGWEVMAPSRGWLPAMTRGV